MRVIVVVSMGLLIGCEVPNSQVQTQTQTPGASPDAGSESLPDLALPPNGADGAVVQAVDAGGCQSDDDCLALLPPATPTNCATGVCDPATHACRFVAVDNDHDGYTAAMCSAAGVTIELGDDCNDFQEQIHPGAWDGPPGEGHVGACNRVDNDCNGEPDDAKLASGGYCQCFPGSTRPCAGKLGSCAVGSETCGSDSTWGACSIEPKAQDSCVPGNDDNCNGAPNEGCPCTGRDTPANYNAACGSCGGHILCDESCSVPTPANLNAACGSCGGRIQCDGSCSVPTPGNFGAACGSCGGTIQCNGSCSVPTPANLNAACGSCGGRIQCNGGCSVATPGNYGQGCGFCGGTVQCNGTCSVYTPASLGQSCGSCGGTIQCSGACSVPTPSNYNQSCGQCGGRVQCGGTCSAYTPPDLGTTTQYGEWNESFSCCWIDYYKWFGGPCNPGHQYAGASVEHFENPSFLGGCDIVEAPGGSDCSVKVHFYNRGTNGANCRIHVNETRTCN